MSISDQPETMTITLEFSPEDPYDADFALVSKIGRDMLQSLPPAYEIAQPAASSHTRGGDFLIDIVTHITHDALLLWEQRDLFEHILNDASALVTICTSGIAPILIAIARITRHNENQRKEPPVMMKIIVEIDHKPVTIEAMDLPQIEAGLKLAQAFYQQHPEAARQVTTKSKTKITGRIAGQPKRKRR